MIEEEQTTQASETADNQSLLAVTKEEEGAAEKISGQKKKGQM